MVMSAGPFSSEARLLNKSARTRAKLMDAAAEVFAQQGFEAASVNEIARRADVANGTFYVHFKDKESIAAEVAARIGGDITGQIDHAMVDMHDAVERLSFGTRQFIEFGARQPLWGWVLIRSGSYLPAMRRQMETHLYADLERCRLQGRISVAVDAFLVDAIMAVVLSALSARLRGDAEEDAGSRASELILNMLNAPRSLAHEVAWKDVKLKELVLTVRPKGDRRAG